MTCKISKGKRITEAEFENFGPIAFISCVTSISNHDFDQILDFHEFESDDHSWELQLGWFQKPCEICVPREAPGRCCSKRLLEKAERMAMNACHHNNIEDQHVEQVQDNIS